MVSMVVESAAPVPATARIALSREARAAAKTPTAATARLWADVLGRVPLFTGVPARQVRKIAGLGTVARFDARAPIVSAGDPGDAFYVILGGRAKVQRGRGRAVAQIGPGSYFGEMALIDGARRSATIVAETETTCLMLTRKRFAKVLRAEPSVALALLGTLAARVRELEASPAD
jgi:CRP-like cAMP-binding protein